MPLKPYAGKHFRRKNFKEYIFKVSAGLSDEGAGHLRRQTLGLGVNLESYTLIPVYGCTHIVSVIVGVADVAVGVGVVGGRRQRGEGGARGGAGGHGARRAAGHAARAGRGAALQQRAAQPRVPAPRRYVQRSPARQSLLQMNKSH